MAKNNKLLKNALKFHQAGQLELAVPIYHKLLKNNPAHEQALYLLGTLYSQQGKAQDALPALKKVLSLNPKHVDALNTYGVVLGDMGEFDNAVQQFKKALQISPEHINGITNLGMVLLKMDKAPTAVKCFERAVTLNPQHAQAHSNLGHAYFQLKNWDAAEASYKKVLLVNPAMVATHYHLGMVYQKKENYEEALQNFKNALACNENFPEAHNELANVLNFLGQKEKAYEHYRRATHLNPKLEKAFIDFGNVALNHKEYRLAADSYSNTLALNPKLEQIRYKLAACLKYSGNMQEALNHAIKLTKESENFVNAHCLIGEIYFTLKDYKSAIQYYQQAIILDEANTRAHNGLGAAFIGRRQRQNGDLERARESFQRVLDLEPEHCETLNNFGFLCRITEQFDEAILHLEKAINIMPDYADAHMNLAIVLLIKGEIQKGWQEYEWRWKTSNQNPRPFCYPVWDDESIENKTILVYGEQGVGDEILFASCIPDLIKICGHCVIECDSKLASLFARSFPEATVLARVSYHDTSSLNNAPPIDFQIAIGSLPSHFRRNLKNFPNRTEGYLKADPDRVLYWKNKLKTSGQKLNIGFSWRSKLTKGIGRMYTQPMSYWALMLNLKNVNFVKMQYDHCEEEIKEVNERWGVQIKDYEEIDLFNDLDEAAALTKAFDLVVSVANSVASMAGALGVPLWRVSCPMYEPFRFGIDEYIWHPNTKIYFSSAYEGSELAEEFTKLLAGKCNVVDNMNSEIKYKEFNHSEYDDAQKHYNIARYEKRNRRFSVAISELDKAIASNLQYTAAYCLLGQIYRIIGSYSLALDKFYKAIDIDKNIIEAHIGISEILLFKKHDVKSVGVVKNHLEKVVGIKPNYFSLLHYLTRLAERLYSLGKSNEALKAMRHIEEINSNYGDAAEIHAKVLFSQKQKRKAWQRLAQKYIARKTNYAEWQGESLNNKVILVYSESSTLFELMCFSCIYDLQKIARRCIVLCADNLVNILRSTYPDLGFNDQQNNKSKLSEKNITVDYQISSGRLANYFERELDIFSWQRNFLKFDTNKIQSIRTKIGYREEELVVGLWLHPATEKLLNKPLETYLKYWRCIFTIPKIRFITYQHDKVSQELNALACRWTLNINNSLLKIGKSANYCIGTTKIDLGNITDLAANLSAMDINISFYPSLTPIITFLSGSLGKETWQVTWSKIYNVQSDSPNDGFRRCGSVTYFEPKFNNRNLICKMLRELRVKKGSLEQVAAK